MDNIDDSKLVQYETYEEYLDSFVKKEDIKYLQNIRYARLLAEFGYRSTGETLTREQFEIRRSIAYEILFPTQIKYFLASEGINTFDDQFLKALAIREKQNVLKSLSTIIFILHHTKSGFDISGYIDFEDSLRKFSENDDPSSSVDWRSVFLQNKRLYPRISDLCYYNWRSGNIIQNDSENYKVISDVNRGLLFMNRADRKMICVDPFVDDPGSYTTRTVIKSEKYDHVVLYDHIVRNNY